MMSEHTRDRRAKSTKAKAKRYILIVDDDSDNQRLLRRALENEGYEVETVESGETAFAYISVRTPDLVLLDMNMPGLSGIQTLKKFRNEIEYVSVIFISGNSQVPDIVSGLDAGADDYIKKPFDIHEVLARVRSQLRIKDVKDELLAANKKLKDLVDFDELTGLLNMRAFYQRLDYELKRGRRFNHSVGIVMMDLDHFKRVNDEHDHIFGSFVLGEVGKIISSSIRSVDFAARYGGDEFIVCLTEATEQGAQLFSERLRNSLLTRTFDNGHDSMKVTVSMGYTLSVQGEPTDAQSLIRAADRALYDAKAGGRNRVCSNADRSKGDAFFDRVAKLLEPSSEIDHSDAPVVDEPDRQIVHLDRPDVLSQGSRGVSQDQPPTPAPAAMNRRRKDRG